MQPQTLSGLCQLYRTRATRLRSAHDLAEARNYLPTIEDNDTWHYLSDLAQVLTMNQWC